MKRYAVVLSALLCAPHLACSTEDSSTSDDATDDAIGDEAGVASDDPDDGESTDTDLGAGLDTDDAAPDDGASDDGETDDTTPSDDGSDTTTDTEPDDGSDNSETDSSTTDSETDDDAGAEDTTDSDAATDIETTDTTMTDVEESDLPEPEPQSVWVRVSSSNALGSVSLDGNDCSFGTACTSFVELGTVVELSAVPNARMEFVGWVADEGTIDCTANTCSVNVTEELTVQALFDSPYNLAFMTDMDVTGDIGGLAGADEMCAAEAELAGLAGEYRAWLSTSEVNAADRFSGTGWVRIDGHPVALDASDLAAGRLLMPIAFMATGERQWANVWTATAGDGTFGGDRPYYDVDLGNIDPGSCDDWTTDAAEDPDTEVPLLATVGSSAHGGSHFTDAHALTCDQSARLFCLGIDKGTTPSVPTSTNRVAFVSEGLFDSGPGRDDADVLCNAEASAAGLSGTFLAMLGTSDGSAASRFDLSGGGWNLVDGVVFVENGEDLEDEERYLTSINVHADGTRLASTESLDSFAYTGGPFGFTPTAAQACDDWTDTTNDGFALMGNPQGAYENAAGCCSGGCSQERRIFCFQE